MSPKGDASKITAEENRWRIYHALLRKSYSYGELRKTLNISKDALNRHLKQLKNDGAIERAIENDKIVWRANYSQEVVEKKLWSGLNKYTLALLAEANFDYYVMWKASVKLGAKYWVAVRLGEIRGDSFPPYDKMSIEKQLELATKHVKEIFSHEELKKMGFEHVDTEKMLDIVRKLVEEVDKES